MYSQCRGYKQTLHKMASTSQPQAVPSTPGILRLSRELRQKIYDYILSDRGDRTLDATLDSNDKLRTHNGATIQALSLTRRQFAVEVFAYLFRNVTLTLTDSERTCYPVFMALRNRMNINLMNRITKLAIPFPSVRHLFDPIHFATPLCFTERLYYGNTTILKPFVLSRMKPDDVFAGLTNTRTILLRDCTSIMGLIGKLRALRHLDLGVDVLEFLILENSPVSCRGTIVEACDFADKRDKDVKSRLRHIQESKGTEKPNNHQLLGVLRCLKAADNLKDMHIRLKWGDFVQAGYQTAGVVILEFTPDVRRKIEEVYTEIAKELIEEVTVANSIVGLHTGAQVRDS